MVRSAYLCIGLLIATLSVNGQSVEVIKANRSDYLWGEGVGATIKKADQEALAMLISQISTQVESNFSLLKSEVSNNGKSNEFKETFQSIIKTYSGATLKNTERIVLNNEPNAKVFRYIKRSEVEKVFRDRKNKILGFIKNAEKSVNNKQIADGLRYYYWALTLLKSHPDGDGMYCYDESGNKQHVVSWIPMQINYIFAELDFWINQIDTDENIVTYTMNITHKQKAVSNLDYSYWTGSDWSNLFSARDGIGVVELYGMAVNAEKIKLKVEYIFEGEARTDRELEDVLSKIDAVSFSHSYFTINVKQANGVNEPRLNKLSIVNAPLTDAGNVYTYKSNIDKIIEGIEQKDYESVRKLFTSEGYETFTKLINYGNAKVVGKADLRFIKFNDKVICRAVPMSFNFKSNNRQFIENVVFHFNSNKRVENITFGLSDYALNDIVKRDVWSERDRIVLVNFLENYKTAYALKRIKYIEHIFADDALIITGKVLKVKPNEVNQYANNQIVKYNRQTKEQYVRNLKYSFASKEYINLKFEESKIRKAGNGGEIYGVQIKQNYYSSNYGDVGYLFLMVDLNIPDEPIIQVRTWQPEVGHNESVFGLSDFY